MLVNYSRNREGGEAVAEACRGQGVEAIATKGDVSSDRDCVALADLALEAWSRIDILVNNAGVTRFADATDMYAL